MQARTFSKTKAEERIKKGKGKEGTYPQSGFPASETPNEERYGHAWESDEWSANHWTDDSWTPDAGWFCAKSDTAWMVATPFNLATHPTHVVLDLTHGRLDQERQPKDSRSMNGIMALRRNSAPVTNNAYQPTTKSRERSGYPKRHVTVSMSERRPAYPAHAPDMDEDEDEDDKPLVRPASTKEFAKVKRDLDTDDEDPLPLAPPRSPPAAPVRNRKGPPVWQDPAATLEHQVPKDSHERTEDTSILGRKAEGEALRISKLSEERNLTDLHLKHHHMSTAQFKNRQLAWIFLENFLTSINTWWRHAHSAIP